LPRSGRFGGIGEDRGVETARLMSVEIHRSINHPFISSGAIANRAVRVSSPISSLFLSEEDSNRFALSLTTGGGGAVLQGPSRRSFCLRNDRSRECSDGEVARGVDGDGPPCRSQFLLKKWRHEVLMSEEYL
jgi:hypothetical protein